MRIDQNLLNAVSKAYKKGVPMSQIGIDCNIGEQKVKKILITTGDYANKTSREIAALLDMGKSEREIAEIMKMTVPGVNAYIPYSKAIYNLGNKSTKNAQAIRRMRLKQSL